MLRNILILTVSILSLQSVSYAADADKPMSDVVSAISQQSVVINEAEAITQTGTASSVVNEVVDSIADPAEVAKVKKTIGQKVKSFFKNLFVCLKATNEVVKDTVDNANAIKKEVKDTIEDIKDNMNSIKS